MQDNTEHNTAGRHFPEARGRLACFCSWSYSGSSKCLKNRSRSYPWERRVFHFGVFCSKKTRHGRCSPVPSAEPSVQEIFQPNRRAPTAGWLTAASSNLDMQDFPDARSKGIVANKCSWSRLRYTFHIKFEFKTEAKGTRHKAIMQDNRENKTRGSTCSAARGRLGRCSSESRFRSMRHRTITVKSETGCKRRSAHMQNNTLNNKGGRRFLEARGSLRSLFYPAGSALDDFCSGKKTKLETET
jgi:hypothetical protein